MFPWLMVEKILRRRGVAMYLPAMLATLLCLPSFQYGLQIDDVMHRCALVDVPGFEAARRPPSELFAFVTGDPQQRRDTMDGGFLPWWSAKELKLSFFRPITGLTHWLDHTLWGESVFLMRLQSLAWFLLLVVSVGVLYRRVMGASLAAGIAVLLFAIDDAHSLPATWIANRNSTISMFFGVVALIGHDVWRRRGATWGAWLAPVAFLLALLSGEIAVSTAGYLLAYALFLDRARGMRRILSLVPGALTGLGWLLYYKSAGYGAAHSGLYVDPLGEPVQFLLAAAVRGPLLLWTQWMAPPAELYYMLPADSAAIALGIAVAFMPVLMAMLWPLLRSDRVARFWLAGMLLSIPPACVMMASNRLVIFIGLGGFGLLGRWLANFMRGRSEAGDVARAGLPTRIAALWLAVVHLLFAPIVFLMAAPTMEQFGNMIVRAARSLPADANDHTVLVVQTPTAFVSGPGPVFAASEGLDIPGHTYVLGSSIYPIEFSRRDERTLVLRPEHGFLAPGGLAHAGRDQRPTPGFAPNQAFMLPPFDCLFRDPALRFEAGERIELERFTVEILEVTTDGRPAEVACVFPKSLDDAAYRWVRWDGGVYVPFDLPRIGESVAHRLRIDPTPALTSDPRP